MMSRLRRLSCDKLSHRIYYTASRCSNQEIKRKFGAQSDETSEIFADRGSGAVGERAVAAVARRVGIPVAFAEVDPFAVFGEDEQPERADVFVRCDAEGCGDVFAVVARGVRAVRVPQAEQRVRIVLAVGDQARERAA